MAANLVLYQWPALPEACSFDVDCIALQAALKLRKVPYRVVNTTSPEMAPKERLPMLAEGTAVVHDADQVWEFVRKLKPEGSDDEPDPLRDPAVAGEHLALWTLLKHSLQPVVMQMLYLRNESLFRPLWAGDLVFPLDRIVPVLRAWEMGASPLARIRGQEPSDLSEQFDEVMGQLEARLARQPYLLGARPSDVDALLYALLLLPTVLPLPDESLYLKMQSFPTTKRFVDEFHRNVFGATLRHKEPMTPGKAAGSGATPSKTPSKTPNRQPQPQTPSRSTGTRR